MRGRLVLTDRDRRPFGEYSASQGVGELKPTLGTARFAKSRVSDISRDIGPQLRANGGDSAKVGATGRRSQLLAFERLHSNRADL